MWNSLTAAVVGVFSTLYLSKYAHCSDSSFLMKEFEWTASLEEPVINMDSVYKIPPRSYDRSTLELSEPLEIEGTLELSKLQLPEDRCFYFQSKLKTNEDSTEWIFSKPIKSPESQSQLNETLYNVLTPRLTILLMQQIFDYLDGNELRAMPQVLPEYHELVESVIFNRIAGTFPRLAGFDSIISGPQIDHLIPAAKLFNYIYPSLNLSLLSSFNDLAALLAISWIISNDSKTLNITESVVKVAKFISTFSDQFVIIEKISSGQSKETFLNRNKLLNNLVVSLLLLKHHGHVCKMAIELLFEFEIITILDSRSDCLPWKLFQTYNSEMRFKLMFDKVQVQLHNSNSIAKDRLRDNIIHILQKTDNAVFLKTYLSHNICGDIREDNFMRRLIAVMFKYSFVNVLNEIIGNPVTSPYLNANQQLLSLPESFFQRESGSSDFFRTLQSTPFFVLLNYDSHNFILRSVFYRNYGLFVALLNSSESLTLPSQQIVQIVRLLNEIRFGKFRWFKSFWSSRIVYAAFNGLTLDERTAILNEIINSRNYFHIFAISSSSFDFYASDTKPLENKDEDDGKELLLIEDGFFDIENVHHIDIYRFFTESDTFIGYPELHFHYILKSLERERFGFFELLFKSKNTKIPLDSNAKIREIIFKLDTLSQLPFGERCALASFWQNGRVREYFVNGKQKVFYQIIRDKIKLTHFGQILVILDQNPTLFNYFDLLSFDIIDYCLNLNVFYGTTADLTVKNGIRLIWKHPNFPLKFPALHEKYRNDQSFMDLIDSLPR